MNENLLVTGDDAPPPVKPTDAPEAEQGIVAAVALAGREALAIIDKATANDDPGDLYTNPLTVKALATLRGLVDAGAAGEIDPRAVQSAAQEEYGKGEGATVARYIQDCRDALPFPEPALEALPSHLQAVMQTAKRRRIVQGADAMTATGDAIKAEAYSGDIDRAAAALAAAGAGGEPAPGAAEILRPFPRELLQVEGGAAVFDAFTEHAYAAFPLPNPVCNLFAAVALVSALAGNKYRAEWGRGARTYPNEYILMLADTGAGKDAGRQIIKDVYAGADLPGLMDDIGSGEGVIDALFQTGGAGFLMADEIGHLLKMLAQERPNPLTSLAPILLKLYSGAGHWHAKRALSKHNQKGKDDTPDKIIPSLTMYGTATPGQFFDNVTLPMFENGLVGRCLVIPGDFGDELHDETRRPNDLPEVLTRYARHCASIDPARPVIVRRDRAAVELVRAIREKTVERRKAAKLAGDRLGVALWARYHEHAEKLATFAAIARNFHEPVIDTACVNWGASIPEWAIEYMARRYAERQADAGRARLDALAERVLSKVPETGTITATELHKKCAWLKSKYPIALATLLDGGRLKVITQGTQRKKGSVTAYARAWPPSPLNQ